MLLPPDLLVFTVLTFQDVGGWLHQQKRGDRRFLQSGIGRRVAVKLLVAGCLEFVEGANAVGVGMAAEFATGFVAQRLSGGEFAVEAAQEVNKFGVIVEMGFGVIGPGEFLEQDLGEVSGGGLEADFRELGGVVPAKKREEVILLQGIFQGLFLGEGPFEITAGEPIGNIALGDALETGVVEGGDDIFVGDRVPKHAIDHIALRPGKTGNAAVAAGVAGAAGVWNCQLGSVDCGRNGSRGVKGSKGLGGGVEGIDERGLGERFGKAG